MRSEGYSSWSVCLSDCLSMTILALLLRIIIIITGTTIIIITDAWYKINVVYNTCSGTLRTGWMHGTCTCTASILHDTGWVYGTVVHDTDMALQGGCMVQ